MAIVARWQSTAGLNNQSWASIHSNCVFPYLHHNDCEELYHLLMYVTVLRHIINKRCYIIVSSYFTIRISGNSKHYNRTATRQYFRI